MNFFVATLVIIVIFVGLSLAFMFGEQVGEENEKHKK